jgi:hypothetical protein
MTRTTSVAAIVVVDVSLDAPRQETTAVAMGSTVRFGGVGVGLDLNER